MNNSGAIPDDPSGPSDTVHKVASSNESTVIPPTSFQLPNSNSKSASPPSLAQRISGRTTDLIAIAVVIVASLTLGRQMVAWWQADPPPILDAGVLAGHETEWGAKDQPVELRFGKSPLSLIRQKVTRGGITAALDVIRAHCQSALLTAIPPAMEPDQSEKDLLAAVETLRPDLEQPGRWQIYQIGGGLVTIAGIRTFPSPESPAGQKPAGSRRVMCWGVAFPSNKAGSWTTFTFIKKKTADIKPPGTPGTPSQSIGQPAPFALYLEQIALPVGCHRTVLLQDPVQGGMAGFEGNGDDRAWTEHFTKELQRLGWIQTEGWRDSELGTSARFTRSGSRPTVDFIQVQWTASGGKSLGLIQWLAGDIRK